VVVYHRKEGCDVSSQVVYFCVVLSGRAVKLRGRIEAVVAFWSYDGSKSSCRFRADQSTLVS